MTTSISVITPTHRVSPYLMELYQSLLLQTFDEWEWVLYLNGGANLCDIPLEISADKRVKILVEDSHSSSIGRIKNLAFSAASGEILVEADHDDILMPNCLASLINAFEDKDVSFVYSDCAYLQTNRPFIPHNPVYGWTHKKFRFEDKELTTMNSFPPSSHAMSYIWWAPNHVRSWRASEYFRIGGHNPALEVCDDHELLIRTYLNGKMKFIDDVLYVYRVDGSNTVYSKNALIQETTIKLNLDYATKLAFHDGETRGKFCLKLRLPGMNIVSNEYSEYLLNLASSDFELKLEDSSVFALDLSDVAHKFRNPMKILSEAYRVLEHGGWLFLDSPALVSSSEYAESKQISFWNENLLRILTEQKFKHLIPNYKFTFMINRLEEYQDESGNRRLRAFLNAVKALQPRFPGKIT